MASTVFQGCRVHKSGTARPAKAHHIYQKSSCLGKVFQASSIKAPSVRQCYVNSNDTLFLETRLEISPGMIGDLKINQIGTAPPAYFLTAWNLGTTRSWLVP